MNISIKSHGLPRAISVRKGIAHETEEDAGANAWFIMAGSQLLYNKDSYNAADQKRLGLILDIADYITTLQNTDRNHPAFGGIRTNLGSPYYSTEFTVSTRAIKMVADF